MGNLYLVVGTSDLIGNREPNKRGRGGPVCLQMQMGATLKTGKWSFGRG